MGCNSHLLIDYKKQNDANWWTYAKDVDESRDYLLYSLMAGVRGDNEPVAQPRGFPEGNNDLKSWFDDYGGHTPSWLYPDEFGAAIDRTIKLRLEARGGDAKLENKPIVDPVWAILRNLLDDLKTNYGNENVRLCFFFDN